jgi:hypothetical protein
MSPILPRKPGFDPRPFLARIERGEAACGDLGLRIDREGRWFYRGSPIGRPALVRLFASILHRLPDGSYWMVTPAEQGTVEVEDVPFVALEMRTSGEGRQRTIEFRTNLDEWVTAGPDHPLSLRLSGEPPVEVPYVLVRDRLEARLARSVFYELVDMAEPTGDGTGLAIWSSGVEFPLGRLDPG